MHDLLAATIPTPRPPAGEVGQIGGRGASLMLGYFDDQSATEDSFNADGWFMTGDLGWIDAQGYLRITGRKKDVIIRGGHNIYPARIEDAGDAPYGRGARRGAAGGRRALGRKSLPRDGVPRRARLSTPTDCCSISMRPGSRNSTCRNISCGSTRFRSRRAARFSSAIVDWIEDGRVTPEPIRFEAKRTPLSGRMS